jgi:predicted negative regulator of RcsB-dependent stress response
MTNPELIDLDDESMELMDWVRANTRWLTIGAAVVVVGGGAYVVYSKSRAMKEQNAATQLFQAKQSLAAGNIVLAQSDLTKLINRYDGTSSGAEGAMMLAQIQYDQAKYQEGIAQLEKSIGSAPGPLQVSMRTLIGDGYLALKNAPAAAKAYEQAAGMTDMPIEKAGQKARAARAYMAAGDTAKARTIWAELAADTKAPSVASEAKVRLGEMTAAVAKSS